jgi:DinB superfamily
MKVAGSATEPLPAWCARLISEFTESDARAEAVARTLSGEELNWKPRPEAWSIGQCLEHLTNGNDLYLDAIEAALTRNLAGGSVPEITPGWFGRWFIRAYMEPSTKTTRATAPKKIAPPSTIDLDVVDRFVRGNERVRAIIRRASDYDVNRVRFTNPFVPVIRFTVGTGFAILAAHERRHLLQAERVRGAFPASPPAATPTR